MSPGGPAGYSGTPLTGKLGIRPEATLGLIGAPDGFDEVLGELPPGVTVRRRLQGRFDVVVAFFVRGPALERRLPALTAALAPAGGLWLAWPKRSSGVETDLGDGAVRALGLAAGLVDNKVCAIDATWSGLRFVYRLTDRPPEGPPARQRRRST
jgi:hypothetical protein